MCVCTHLSVCLSTCFRVYIFMLKNLRKKCGEWKKFCAYLPLPTLFLSFKMLNLPFRAVFCFQSIMLSPVAKHNVKNTRLSRGVYCVCSPPGTVAVLLSFTYNL